MIKGTSMRKFDREMVVSFLLEERKTQDYSLDTHMVRGALRLVVKGGYFLKTGYDSWFITEMIRPTCVGLYMKD